MINKKVSMIGLIISNNLSKDQIMNNLIFIIYIKGKERESKKWEKKDSTNLCSKRISKKYDKFEYFYNCYNFLLMIN